MSVKPVNINTRPWEEKALTLQVAHELPKLHAHSANGSLDVPIPCPTGNTNLTGPRLTCHLSPLLVSPTSRNSINVDLVAEENGLEETS